MQPVPNAFVSATVDIVLANTNLTATKRPHIMIVLINGVSALDEMNRKLK